MSVESWIKEFIPVVGPADMEDALVKCIKKYKGATRKNLEKHEVDADWAREKILGAPCALCQLLNSAWKGCGACPLQYNAGLLGEINCDHREHPYWEFLRTKDATELIALMENELKKLREREERHNGRKRDSGVVEDSAGQDGTATERG